MSEGMLGKLPLPEIRGPRDTLENLLAGDEGESYLQALNKMLRGENPWPIVSRVEEGYKVTAAELDRAWMSVGKTFKRMSRQAREILEAGEFDEDSGPHVHKAGVEIVLLYFEPWTIEERKVQLKLPHVLTEMKRLRLSRPARTHALAFGAMYPLSRNDNRKVVFLHKPVGVRSDSENGMDYLWREPDGKHLKVLRVENSSLDGLALETHYTRFLSNHEYVYAAVRPLK